MIGIKVNTDDKYAYVSMNYRHIIENGWIDDLKYQCDPTEKHNKRTTVKFICSRACAQQLTRHRCASFSMESQRFCGYNKDKFDGSITYVYLGDGIDPIQAELYQHAEHAYMELINKGFKPQEARMVLPNATKTELVMTAFQSDWNSIFDLRCSDKADDEIRYLCNKVKEII
nr:MAG TPA: Thymidylate synthase complementing protein [Bacteriophage sp.]